MSRKPTFRSPKRHASWGRSIQRPTLFGALLTLGSLFAPLALADPGLGRAFEMLAQRGAFSDVAKSALIRPKSLAESKLDGRLWRAAAEGTSKSLLDGDDSIAVDSRGIGVVVKASNDSASDVAAVARRVRALGGTVATTFDDEVYATVPAERLSELAQSEAVSFIEPQAVMLPSFQDSGDRGGAAAREAMNSSAKDGARMVNIDAVHKLGIRGKGVKVGVLDFGYQNYESLVARGALPKPLMARAFNADNDLAGTTPHGTGSVEMVFSMAPEADVIVANIGDSAKSAAGNWLAGAKWLIEQKVDLITHSGGSIGGSHREDLGSDRIVKVAAENGILWINAAGNEALSYWGGRLVDQNANQIVDVPGQSAGDFMIVETEGRGFALVLNWDDWPSSGAGGQSDLQLVVFSGDGRVVAATNTPRANGAPQKSVVVRVPPGRYGVAIGIARAPTKPVNVRVFSRGDARSWFPVSREGSISNPATSADALAVGAIDVRNRKLAPYSSRGPLDDGRLKPEVAAPTEIVSLAYNGRRYNGTSAAAPHVAGLAALIKQANPNITLAQWRQRIVDATIALQLPSPNSDTGYGLIDGPKLAALIGQSARPPAPPTPTPQPTPPARDDGVTDPKLRDTLGPLLDALRRPPPQNPPDPPQ
jgi:subtilisin family serine protease